MSVIEMIFVSLVGTITLILLGILPVLFENAYYARGLRKAVYLGGAFVILWFSIALVLYILI